MSLFKDLPIRNEMTASRHETNASDLQIDFRAQLLKMYQTSPLPDAELAANLGMYLRASVLVKFLVLNDLYLRILKVPEPGGARTWFSSRTSVPSTSPSTRRGV